MDQYISKCTLQCNGKEITDFTAVSEGEIVRRKAINLMNKTGFSKLTPRFTLSLDYAVPSDSPVYNFEAVENGTVVIEYEGGQRVNYSGVCHLKTGDSSLDGDKELTRKIEFAASSRTEE